MANYGLDCIVCGKRLPNVMDDVENQPYDATSFTTYGHYGSTVFDPMDGTFLEINICDEDLKEASKKSRVLMGQARRPVMTPKHVLLGWETLSREYVYWDAEKNYLDEEDRVVVHDEEDFHELCEEKDRFGRPKIEWSHPLDVTLNLLLHDIDVSEE